MCHIESDISYRRVTLCCKSTFNRRN